MSWLDWLLSLGVLALLGTAFYGGSVTYFPPSIPAEAPKQPSVIITAETLDEALNSLGLAPAIVPEE